MNWENRRGGAGPVAARTQDRRRSRTSRHAVQRRRGDARPTRTMSPMAFADAYSTPPRSARARSANPQSRPPDEHDARSDHRVTRRALNETQRGRCRRTGGSTLSTNIEAVRFATLALPSIAHRPSSNRNTGVHLSKVVLHFRQREGGCRAAQQATGTRLSACSIIGPCCRWRESRGEGPVSTALTFRAPSLGTTWEKPAFALKHLQSRRFA